MFARPQKDVRTHYLRYPARKQTLPAISTPAQTLLLLYMPSFKVKHTLDWGKF